MISKIKRFLSPMSSRIENKTLNEYTHAFVFSLEIYLLVLQIIYLLQSKITLLKWFFVKGDVLEFLLSLFINNATFIIILTVVNIIRKNKWKNDHKSDCYISGTWYYVFHRETDSNKEFVRAGFLEISQNYYDIEVLAENYNVFLSDNALEYDKSSYSHWFFLLGEIDKDGNVFGCYSKDNIKNSANSSTGIMSFYKPPQNCNGKIKKLRGNFKDSAQSQVSGNIDLYKMDSANSTESFLESAPNEWIEEVERILREKTHTNKPNLCEIVKSAAKILPGSFEDNDNVYQKDGKKNIVTDYDVIVQNYLIDHILAVYPNAVFLCEENVNQLNVDKGDIFVIDPIDGTTNFSNNSKFSAISVARICYGNVVEAVVYNPYLDEMFYAKKGEGAYLNTKRIRVKDKPLDDSIVGYTNCPYDLDITDSTFKFGQILFNNALDLRRMGCSALEICYAACGRYQLYCEMILYPWDYLAAKLIVEEAGGIVTDLNNEALQYNKRCSVVAGAKTAHNEVLKLFNKFKMTNEYVKPSNINL